MIRILLLLVPVILVYLGIQWFQRASADEKRVLYKKVVLIIVIIALLILTTTGRLNVLFTMLGVFIVFLLRLMPSILRYAPQLHRLWALYMGAKPYKDNSNQESTHRQRGTTMSKAEALEVLGLKPGASDNDIIQAHRKLISRLHPDKGGSDYLAAQINLAKKILLGS